MAIARAAAPLFGIALLLLPAASFGGDGLLDPFEIFRPLFGAVWTGAYEGDDEGRLTHVYVWEPVLGGRAVRGTKNVPEADFTAETLFFWDAGENRIAYVTVTNNDNVVRGWVHAADGVLTEEGHRLGQAGDADVRSTFEVLADGTLEDRFFILIPGGWKQGHLIRYSAERS